MTDVVEYEECESCDGYGEDDLRIKCKACKGRGYREVVEEVPAQN
jgi:DnaJ-class molecular chaperone